MMSIENDTVRLEVDLPERYLVAAKTLLSGVGAHVRLMPEAGPLRFPDSSAAGLFSMVEDPHAGKLIPLIQRPHLKHYALMRSTSRSAGQFISGIWVYGPNSKLDSLEKQQRMLDYFVVRDRSFRVSGIKADKAHELHSALDENRLNIRNVGSKTIDFFGQFCVDLEASLAEQN